jgi:hypothetical protein
MEGLPPDVRRYSDKEISRILRRASQIQRETPARPDPAGLTLAELEEIAVEAGIDVDNLRAAASELSADPDDDSWQTRMLGAPLTQRLVRRIPGELPAEAFGSLVPILQTESGVTGQASTVGRTLTWASTASGNNTRSLNILVMAEGGETLVQLEERSNQTALAFHLGFSMGGLGFAIPAGAGLGATLGVALGVAAGVGVGGVFYLIGRTLYGATTRARRRKVETLFDKLVERVRVLIAADPSLQGGGPEALTGGEVGGPSARLTGGGGG